MQLNPLTQREIEALVLLASGHRYTTAAEKLGVSADTIRSRAWRATAKLGARSVMEGVAVAIRRGLLPEESPLDVYERRLEEIAGMVGALAAEFRQARQAAASLTSL